MDTAQQRLFSYIQTNKAVTATELSKALGMTPANARHHLAALRKAGLVIVDGERSQLQRGRPAAIYRVSDQALGHNLDTLLIAWLEECIFPLPEDAQKMLWKSLAHRMTSEIQSQMSNKPPAGRNVLMHRLSLAIPMLNAMHYQARWEAHADAPRVIFGHCPYFAIRQKYAQICLLDSYILEALVNKSVRPIANLAADQRGAYHCIFLIEY